MIERNNVLGDVAQLIVRENIFAFGRDTVFLDIQGEITQLGDGSPDAEGEAGEDEEENQRHDSHEVDKVFVYRHHTLRVRGPRKG